MTPDAIKKLAALLAELPSLGPRQATRLAFHIAGADKRRVEELIDVLTAVSKVKRCTHCFVLDELTKGLCSVCASPRRNHSVITIVEKETDVHTLEKVRAFTGRYLVLGELTKDGVLSGEQKKRLETLRHFIRELPEKKAEEIILGLAPTTLGDTAAQALTGSLKDFSKKLTRLARGLPTGGEIEFADEETLENALKNRY